MSWFNLHVELATYFMITLLNICVRFNNNHNNNNKSRAAPAVATTTAATAATTAKKKRSKIILMAYNGHTIHLKTRKYQNQFHVKPHYNKHHMHISFDLFFSFFSTNLRSQMYHITQLRSAQLIPTSYRPNEKKRSHFIIIVVV